MAVLKEGSKAPDFNLPGDDGETLSLKNFKGRKLVLYFYPKDDTPGCTAEACAFNDNLSAFRRLKAAVIGISKDSLARHQKFRRKYGLEFALLSDEEGAVIQKYGAWVEKSMYGKKYMGIDRSSFLIDENGKIVKIWRKVKVSGHVDEILAALKPQKEKSRR